MKKLMLLAAALALPLAAQAQTTHNAAPTASRAVQQGIEHGFRDCAPDLDAAVKLVHEDDGAYAHLGAWSTKDANRELFNSLTAAPGQGLTSFSGVKTAAGRCNTLITQVVVAAQPCERVQKEAFKDWKVFGQLGALPLLEDPTTPSINVVLQPVDKKTCLVLKQAVLYGR